MDTEVVKCNFISLEIIHFDEIYCCSDGSKTSDSNFTFKFQGVRSRTISRVFAGCNFFLEGGAFFEPPLYTHNVEWVVYLGALQP